MPLKKLFIGMIAIILTLHIEASTTLVYKKETGGREVKTTYTVDKTEDGYVVESVSSDQTTTRFTATSNPYTLTSFSSVSKKNNDQYTFTLKGSVLTADGIIKGQKLHVTHKLGKDLWVQDFEFGLLPLLTSNRKSLDFGILHPKNFKLHKMTAKKGSVEPLQVGGNSYQAQTVQISLQGFKGMFWKAHLWYDTATHDLLMYKANEGPHTPTTIISLISKADSIE